MNPNLTDTKLIAQLEDIRTNHLEAYLNLKTNIDMVYQKLALEEMEKSFLDWQTCDHTIYQIAPAARVQFAWYLKEACQSSCESYFVVAPDQSHAALYHLDAKRFISGRCHLFGKEDIVEALETFEGYMLPILQDCSKHFDENVFNTSNARPSEADFDTFESESDTYGLL